MYEALLDQLFNHGAGSLLIGAGMRHHFCQVDFASSRHPVDELTQRIPQRSDIGDVPLVVRGLRAREFGGHHLP